MRKNTSNTNDLQVQCEKCEHFRDPKFDLDTHKFTKAKCVEGMKLYYNPPSAYAEDVGMWGYVRICARFRKKAKSDW